MAGTNTQRIEKLEKKYNAVIALQKAEVLRLTNSITKLVENLNRQNMKVDRLRTDLIKAREHL